MRDRPVDFSSSDVVVAHTDCSGRTPLSEERFQNDESFVECVQCGASLGYHDRHLVRTDDFDPVRSIEAVPNVSWYHSSTFGQWPPLVAAARDRAMHLGTYEAALDAMYHRMDKMVEADRRFFLHRVTLRPDAEIDPLIHPDIGELFTGFVPLSVVTDGGYTVRRYVNAAEHCGSISLAISLEAIDVVQTIAIPDPAHALVIASDTTAAEATMGDAVAAAYTEHREAVAAFDAKEPPPPNPNPIVQGVLDRARTNERLSIDVDLTVRTRAAEGVSDALLQDRYMRSAVSAERCEDISSALRTRANQTGDSLHDLYRLHAPLLLNPGCVLASLAARPPYRSPVLGS